MLFSELPPEIVISIAKQLESEKDISSIMRTSARNYQLLLSFLYEHNVKFSSGSALIWCVDHENEAGVKLLLQFGASATEGARIYYTDAKLLPKKLPVGSLYFARSVAMAKLLLDAGAHVDNTPGLEAETGAYIKPRGWGSPLHAAAEKGNIAVAKFLLENGADVNYENDVSATPLHIAADQRDVDLATLLLDYGADVNALDEEASGLFDYYGTPLHFSLLDREHDTSYSMVNLLLERGASLEIDGEASATPLHIAAAACSLPTLKLLLDHAARTNARDGMGETPLFRVVAEPDPDVAYPDPNIQRPDLDMAKLLIDHGALVDIEDNMGITPLFLAAENETSDISKLLLDHGARVRARPGETNFRNPLLQAISMGVPATVELLINHGAEVNAQDNRGSSCLHYAVRGGTIDIEIMEVLLSHGALVDMQDKSGRTALHDTVRTAHLATADLLLLRKGVLVKELEMPAPMSYDNQSRQNHLAAAKVLIDHGASFTIPDARGISAWDEAEGSEKHFDPSHFVGPIPDWND
ncbi:hypothetical protein V495_04850 [Pseudogymnoascus sp. VKM F-4514 (FW-929)]|nr:hypothetical protein V495_04850 [Pseudogymnoascus sp. VKM F-4514 (FW-929)]KFY57898.1 hypothetical protein V497_05155 [Pseudogymnoascus sp. VKM F-4516 (FW-969)]